MQSSPSITPSITVVLPVYKSSADHLRDQIDALAGQNYSNFTVVVVDDGCPQHSGDLVRAWTAEDPRFMVIDRPENGGIAAATNTGLDAATGDVVVFVDHDDVIHRMALQAIADHFAAHPGDDIVYTDERVIDGKGAWVTDYRKPDWSPERFVGQHYINHLTALRRTLIGDERLRGDREPVQDYDFLLRLTRRAGGIGHIPFVLYSWRAHEGSIALAAGEKEGVEDALVASAGEHLQQLGRTATVTPINATCLRIDYAAGRGSTTLIDRSAGVRQADQAIRAATTPYVTLVDAPTEDIPSWTQRLVALAEQSGAAIVAPKLVGADGRLVSLGRVHRDNVRDLFAGVEASNPGPWGSFLVTREVSSVAPTGATIRRESYLAVGGFDDTEDWDGALAALSHRLRRRGESTLVTPHAELRVTRPVDKGPDDAAIAALVAEHADLEDMLIERFAPVGGDPVDHLAAQPGDSAYTPIRRAVDSGDIAVLTSDVFDTLVWRAVAQPFHLWVDWGRRWIADGRFPVTATPRQFADARVAAEVRARELAYRRDETAECTLEEIWEQMPERWIVGSRTDMAAAELDVEVDALRPIPAAIAELQNAIDRGLQVILISDTYLSVEQLGDVLDRVGLPVDELTAIVTSSSRRKAKWQGLVHEVIAELQVPGYSVLHIGDNWDADIIPTRAGGVFAVHLGVHDDVTKAARKAVQHYSLERGSDAGVGAAYRQTIVDAGELGQSPSYQFGAGVAAPLMAGFARWAATTSAAQEVPALHCLLREGAVIADLVGRVAPEVNTQLVHASRWVTMRAAVIDGTLDELTEAVARRAEFRAEHITDAFGIDLARVRAIVGEGPVRHRDRDAALATLLDDEDLRGEILTSSATIRQRVMRYLNATLGGLDTGRLVLCDIGWGGTIQAGLTRILASEGVEVGVTGLYLALSPSGVRRQAAGLDLRSYLAVHGLDRSIDNTAAVISRNPEILERVMTPRLGTLVDITPEGEPVCRDIDHDPRSASLENAQRGMVDMIDVLVRPPWSQAAGVGLPDDPWVTDPEWRKVLGEAMARTLQTPPAELARELSTWHHDDVAGTGSATLIETDLGATMRFHNVVSAGEVSMDEVFWMPGLAAIDNPLLAAQMAAVEAGVDAEALSPYGPLGHVLAAVFGEGPEAALQLRRRPRVSADGWMFTSLRGAVDGVRVIRIDPGEGSGLLRLGALRVRLDDGTQRWTLETSDADHPALRWINGRPIGGPVAAVGAETMVLISPPDDWLHRPCAVEVFFGYAAWESPAAAAMIAEPRWKTAAASANRKVRAVGRRLAERRRH